MHPTPTTALPALADEAAAQLGAYLRRYPEETDALAQLREQLKREGASLFSRANMAGHLTTSGLVYDRAADQVLLIQHRTLKRWLQPGGHHEGSDSLQASAAREVAEETGVRVVPATLEHGAPFDIDTHAIPANPAKGEGAHWHHDFVYLFEADSTQALNPQWAEVSGVRWLARSALVGFGESRMRRLAAKLERSTQALALAARA